MSLKRGEWLQCASCGEESLFTGHEPMEWTCSVCGCGAPIVDAEDGDRCYRLIVREKFRLR